MECGTEIQSTVQGTWSAVGIPGDTLGIRGTGVPRTTRQWRPGKCMDLTLNLNSAIASLLLCEFAKLTSFKLVAFLCHSYEN